MSEAKYDAWTKERLSDEEILYRRHTTRYYAYGGPHPLKAPDEIRRRMAKSPRVWRDKMKRTLAYAEQRKREWIAKLRSEEEYLRAAGWTTKPFEHEEFLGDHDTWVSPSGVRMSRMGAMSEQCKRDGHDTTKNVKGPSGIPLVCCSRCGAAFAIGSV